MKTRKINGADWPTNIVKFHLKNKLLRKTKFGFYERKCSGCEKKGFDPWWPADTEFFYKKGKGRLGACKACFEEYESQRVGDKDKVHSSWEKLFDGVRTVSYEPYRPSITSGKQAN